MNNEVEASFAREARLRSLIQDVKLEDTNPPLSVHPLFQEHASTVVETASTDVNHQLSAEVEEVQSTLHPYITSQPNLHTINPNPNP